MVIRELLDDSFSRICILETECELKIRYFYIVMPEQKPVGHGIQTSEKTSGPISKPVRKLADQLLDPLLPTDRLPIRMKTT
jgi:hypothetical protein